MDTATITSASATQILMALGGVGFTLTGTGFTTTVIDGTEYINSGTVDAIALSFGPANHYSFTDLAMSGGRCCVTHV